MSIEDLVFAGFNFRVLALDRRNGEIVWQWKADSSPFGGGNVTLLVDEDRLIVSVDGYLYCLDPSSGELLWQNETQGCGLGVACLATIRSHSAHEALVQSVRRKRAGSGLGRPG